MITNKRSEKLVEVSTDELIEELFVRCEKGLFIGVKGEEFNPDGYWWEAKGKYWELYGLMKELDVVIEQDRAIREFNNDL